MCEALEAVSAFQKLSCSEQYLNLQCSAYMAGYIYYSILDDMCVWLCITYRLMKRL